MMTLNTVFLLLVMIKKKETCDIQCFDLLIASSKNNQWWPVVIPYTTIFTYNYKDKKINQLNEITKIQYA